MNCPVLLIGKSGVGDAVDSYNLNSTYVSSYQVKVLGGIFNKIPLDGYYSLEYCSAAITSYFQQYRSYEMPYGYIPILQDDDNASSNENVFIQECHGVNHDITKNDHSDYRNDYNISDTKDTTQSKININLQHMNKKRSSKLQFTSFEWKLSDAFIEHVDIQRLMHDLWCYEVIQQIRIYNIYIYLLYQSMTNCHLHLVQFHCISIQVHCICTLTIILSSHRIMYLLSVNEDRGRNGYYR